MRLASSPGLLAAVVVTGAVLGFTVASRPVLIAGSAGAAQASAVEAGCPLLVGLRIARPAVFGVDRPGVPTLDSVGRAIEREVATVAPLGERVVTVFLGSAAVTRGSSATPVQVIARSGFADHVDVIASAPSVKAGAWVPDSLGLGVHDRLNLTINGQTRVVPIKAVIHDLAGERDKFWCSLSREFEPFGAFQPPPVLLVDDEFVDELAAASGAATRQVSWEYPPPAQGWDLDEVREVVPELERIAEALNDRTSELHRATGGGSASADVTGVLAQADRAAATVDAAGAPVVAGTAAAALLTLLGTAPIWAERRTKEMRLLRLHGAGTVLVTLKALAEITVPLAAGLVLGSALAVAAVPLLGVAAPSPATTADALQTVVVGFVVVVLALVPPLVAVLRDRPRQKDDRLPVWEPVALAIAAAALYELRKRDSSIVAGSEIDFLVVLFPAALLLGISGLAGRMVSSRVALGRLAASSSSPLWLAGRRLSAHRIRFVALLTSAAVAAGAVVFAFALSASLAATTLATVLLPHGAEEVVEFDSALERSELGAISRKRATVVERATETGVQARGRPALDVLGVDPKSFSRGAFWDPAFADRSLEDILRMVETRAGQRPVVLVAGIETPPEEVVLTLPGRDGDVEISAVVGAAPEAFPGMGHRASGRPLAIVDAEVLAAAGARTTPFVWAKQGSLDGVDLPTAEVRGRIRPLDGTTSLSLEAHSTAASYVAVVGVAAALVTLAGVGLYLGANRANRVIGDAIAAALDVPRRVRFSALVVELAAILLNGVVIGTVTALTALRLIEAHIDPLPLAAPEPILRLQPAVPLICAAAALFAATATATFVHVLSRRHPLGTVLRNG